MVSQENTQSVNANQEIKELGTINAARPITILNIIGEVEGHTVLPAQSKATKYEHIIPLLEEVEQSPEKKGVLMVLNTMGGDVEAGLAIAELVRGLSKPSVSLVLGGGHSIGVPLAVCTQYSFIAPTASMMVHPIRMTGLVIGVSQTYAYFNKMQERVTQFICSNSRVKRSEFERILLNKNKIATDIGSVLIGKQAVDIGLIDSIGSLSDALNKLNSLIRKTD